MPLKTQMNVSITDLLSKASAADLPQGQPYASRYESVRSALRGIEKNVVALASVKDGGLLTDHGTDHVDTVVLRIDDLLANADTSLSPYEAYLILMAASLHDIGNVKGRANHEYGAEDFARDSGLLLGEDTQEKRTITRIAAAHGGSYKGNQDKLSLLQREERVLGKRVRTRFLAALLRFADELADDTTRSSRYLFEKGAVPTSSEVYHKYALSLTTPDIAGDSITLRFDLIVSDLTRTFGKGQQHVLLIDEIFERTRKMDRERLYCMRSLRPDIALDRINVRIEVFSDSASQFPELAIEYRLEEIGYPTGQAPDFQCACSEPSLKILSATTAGSILKSFVESQKEPS